MAAVGTFSLIVSGYIIMGPRNPLAKIDVKSCMSKLLNVICVHLENSYSLVYSAKIHACHFWCSREISFYNCLLSFFSFSTMLNA